MENEEFNYVAFLFHYPYSGLYLFWDQQPHLKIKFYILDFCFHGLSDHVVSEIKSCFSMWDPILTYFIPMRRTEEDVKGESLASSVQFQTGRS